MIFLNRMGIHFSRNQNALSIHTTYRILRGSICANRSFKVSLYQNLHTQFSQSSKSIKITADQVREAALTKFKNCEYASSRVAYVEKMLSKGILDNPTTYMQTWEKERGHTQEYRIAEDAVRDFFKKFFQSKDIKYK